MKRFALLLLPIALLSASCTTVPSNTEASGETPSCCATNLPTSPTFSEKSLYQVESTWTSDASEQIKLGKLQGRVQVVAMFFSSCTYACPIIMHDMRRIESALPESARAKTGFTLITIDTERDKPEVLQSYRATHKLPADRWTLLHGTPDDTLELAALLGVRFKREASGQFAHSNLVTVLNSEGEIIHQLVGLNQDIEETLQRITNALTK